MKKSILGLAILLISNLTFACHVPADGWCGGQAHFSTGAFANGATYEFRYFGDTTIIFTYVAPLTGSADTSFMLPQPNQNTPIEIQFRELLNGTWSKWWGNKDTPNDRVVSSTNLLPGCSTLAVKFSDVSGNKNGNDYTIQFKNSDESIVSYYDVMMSEDGQHFDKVDTVQATGQHDYRIKIAGGAVAIAFVLPFLGFISNNKKYRVLFYIVGLALSVFIFSCQKDLLRSEVKKNYKAFRIDAVTKDNAIIKSDVKPI